MDKVEKYGCEHYKRKCALIVRECYINVIRLCLECPQYFVH